VILRRSLLAAFVVGGLATPAAAEWRLPCIIGGCSRLRTNSLVRRTRPIASLLKERRCRKGEQIGLNVEGAPLTSTCT